LRFARFAHFQSEKISAQPDRVLAWELRDPGESTAEGPRRGRDASRGRGLLRYFAPRDAVLGQRRSACAIRFGASPRVAGAPAAFVRATLKRFMKRLLACNHGQSMARAVRSIYAGNDSWSDSRNSPGSGLRSRMPFPI
jgi:hypothetical protein